MLKTLDPVSSVAYKICVRVQLLLSGTCFSLPLELATAVDLLKLDLVAAAVSVQYDLRRAVK